MVLPPATGMYCQNLRAWFTFRRELFIWAQVMRIVAYAFSARNRSVSISGFWMDATEITNNEYRQFVYWVRDSVVAKKIGYVKSDTDGNEYVDWAKMRTIKWDDPKTVELLGQSDILLSPEDRIFGKKEIDPSKIVYQSERFNLKEAAQRENANKPRSSFY